MTKSARELRRIASEYMFGAEHGPAFEEAQQAMDASSADHARRLLSHWVRQYNSSDVFARFRRRPPVHRPLLLSASMAVTPLGKEQRVGNTTASPNPVSYTHLTLPTIYSV